ncbi:2-polyprenyl-6-methoxyphenol hydroxylase [Devosia enhydra]|uniref:2-polyprenyl-6-methoxyphenol hydroxylase n=1 Tax=Devosia enhydra TaxID=665118 RepID=A0A1K2HYH3_9HYPH|nr:FAD-dependent oxidoreductase [Devosia enhydra]SFZ84650.1 2-polyprenyl-6-methoxyphenol hydroxylase [Devosia enhydra]
MPAIRKALIVGGGIAGMSAAISLTEAGVAVDLIDRDPEWKVAGAGITITGPTLRAMGQLGILDQVLAQGYAADGLLACDHHGSVLAEIGTQMGALSGIPGAGGITRPVLHAIMGERCRALGFALRLGITVSAIAGTQRKRIIFSDGSEGEYDLVVGADGIFSQMRGLAFPEAPQPHFVGQICWRLTTPRLPGIDRRTYFLGGPSKVGLNPVSQTQMYMFLLEPASEIRRLAPDVARRRLAELMRPYGGAIAQLREALDADAQINVRPLETLLLPAPWHRGNVLLIGDAAHATTPQLASGAGMAIEDGIVLGEEIAAHADLGAALEAFMARRHPRCSLVVAKSLELGRLERAVSDPLQQVRVVEEALALLNHPI